MTDDADTRPKLYGSRPSGLTRAVRLALGELDASYVYIDLDSRAIADGALDAVNPYRMTPTYVDANGPVAETVAILFYLAVEHGRLLPESPPQAGRALQWTLIAAGAIYADTVTGLATARLVPAMRGQPADEAHVAACAKRVKRHLDIVEPHIAETGFLAGGALTIADLMLLPSIDYLRRTPEGEAMMRTRPALAAWYAELRGQLHAVECLD